MPSACKPFDMPSRSNCQQCRRLLVVGVLLGVLWLPSLAAEAAEDSVRWHIVETANFRLLSYGQHPASREVAEHCEQLRADLAAKWFSNRPDDDWSPKCDLVLHSSDASYLREVGPGGRSSLASALVDRHEGRIAARRVDIRASQGDWRNSALAHELVHVILADRFAHDSLPRWINEGAAILADPPEKRLRHGRDVRRAVAAGAHFRLAELLALPDYPPQGRWSTFYDQSADLVDYLVQQQGHARFATFVEISLEHGYDQATRTVYGCGLAELERRWQRSLSSPRQSRLGSYFPSDRLTPASGGAKDS